MARAVITRLTHVLSFSNATRNKLQFREVTQDRLVWTQSCALSYLWTVLDLGSRWDKGNFKTFFVHKGYQFWIQEKAIEFSLQSQNCIFSVEVWLKTGAIKTVHIKCFQEAKLTSTNSQLKNRESHEALKGYIN